MPGAEGKNRTPAGPAAAGTAPADSPVRPRWEWRTFSRRIPLDPRIVSPEPGPARESEETYLLSDLASDNVKVRNGLLDIKRLEKTSHGGLEQWRPTLKTPFPLSGAALRTVCDSLGVVSPDQPVPDLAAFLERVVTRHPALHAVPVRKRRAAITVAGCPGEHVTLSLAGEAWESLSFEHEDPERVLGALRNLRLTPHNNLSYPRALKQIMASSSVPGVLSQGGR